MLDYTDEEIEALKDDEDTVDQFAQIMMTVMREEMVEKGLHTREEVEAMQLKEFLRGWLDGYAKEAAENSTEK